MPTRNWEKQTIRVEFNRLDEGLMIKNLPLWRTRGSPGRCQRTRTWRGRREPFRWWRRWRRRWTRLHCPGDTIFPRRCTRRQKRWSRDPISTRPRPPCPLSLPQNSQMSLWNWFTYKQCERERVEESSNQSVAELGRVLGKIKAQTLTAGHHLFFLLVLSIKQQDSWNKRSKKSENST